MSEQHKNSLKYNRMIKNIPTSSTLAEAGRKAGYAPSTCKSNIYSMENKIRLDLAKLGYTKEAIQAEFERLSAKCEQIGDMSNAVRSTENIAKLSHLYNEGTNTNTAIFNLTPEDSAKLRAKLNNTKDLEQNKPI